MLEKSNTWPEQVLDTLNSCWRALLESCSNTQANVRWCPSVWPVKMTRTQAAVKMTGTLGAPTTPVWLAESEPP